MIYTMSGIGSICLIFLCHITKGWYAMRITAKQTGRIWGKKHNSLELVNGLIEATVDVFGKEYLCYIPYSINTSKRDGEFTGQLWCGVTSSKMNGNYISNYAPHIDEAVEEYVKSILPIEQIDDLIAAVGKGIEVTFETDDEGNLEEVSRKYIRSAVIDPERKKRILATAAMAATLRAEKDAEITKLTEAPSKEDTLANARKSAKKAGIK